jgi:aminoglycoside phosphotransferase (APT) family kinase protein
MVLEDLGERTADFGDAAERGFLLQALGDLHGHTVCRSSWPASTAQELPTFDPDSAEHRKWGELLSASAQVDAGIEPWMAELFATLVGRVARELVVLGHGDLDSTNVVCTSDGVALIDWEKAALVPACLDLGSVLPVLGDIEELEAYRTAFAVSSGEMLDREALRRWVDLGDAYDCFRWICYYLERARDQHDPGEEWRQTYFRPRLTRLKALTARITTADG